MIVHKIAAPKLTSSNSEIAADLRAHAAALIVIADALDESTWTPGPASRPERLLDTAQARRLCRVESSTLYRWARRFGVGHKVGGAWRFSETKLLVLLAGEIGEIGDGQ